jgi:hypothetical protein
VADISVDSEAEEDIAACATADSSWYSFMLTFQNAADGTQCAAWAESNSKLFGIDLADTAIKTSATSDLAYTNKGLSHGRSFVSYHALVDEFMTAAWLGNCLPFDPGTETWMFKTLSGVTADILTDAEVGYIKGKYGNCYTIVAGVAITQWGWTSLGATMFIDQVRFTDFAKARIAEDVFGVLAANKKIPYTDGGIALIQNVIQGRLDSMVEPNGGLAANPRPICTVPAAADVSSTNRGNRALPDVAFSGYRSGAIHSVAISGVLSV